MGKGGKQALFRWLEAERRGDDGAAERALGGLWRHVPRPVPRRGFARRALRHAGLGRRRPAWTLPGPRWAHRGALVAALFLIAASITVVPLSLVRLAAAGDRLVGVGIGLVASLSERLAHGLTAWNVATRISESLVAVVTEPPALAALTAALLTSLFAFGWLRQLLALERSTKHA